MKTRQYLLGVVCWMFVPGALMAENLETGFLDRTLVHEEQQYRYQIYVPRAYEPAQAWPVILFLHGSGERGSDGLKQTQVGLGGAIRFSPQRWPAIVVFPQAPEGESWSGPIGRMAMATLQATLAEFNIDQSRIYLTGLSLGGRGVWQLACEYPDRFAALVPVCGFVEGYGRYAEFLPESEAGPYAYLAHRLAHIPTWIFHGDADPVVPVDGARTMAVELDKVGAPVQYSELPEVGHNAWDPAYGNADLANWLFSQKRETR